MMAILNKQRKKRKITTIELKKGTVIDKVSFFTDIIKLIIIIKICR